MPIVKSIPIRATVQSSLEYILNPDKTEDLLYTSSLNCITDPADAYLNMKIVYEQYSGKKFDEPIPKSGKARVKAIHYIQSFSPDENITSKQAHQIAKAFVLKSFGENCQAVISTHCDKSHIHSHVIINSYSIDGKRFVDNKKSRNRIRNISDRVCLAFGFKPLEKKSAEKISGYGEWNKKKKGTSWKEKIRNDIDRLIPNVKNLDELLHELENMGYEVKRGKYISIKAPEQKRFVHTKTLGDEYTEKSLVSRITWSKVGIDVTPVKNIPSAMRNRYSDIIGQIKPVSSDNSERDIHILSAQLTIINRDRITSIGELEWRLDVLKNESEEVRQELNELTKRYNALSSLLEQVNIFKELSAKDNLSEKEKVQLEACRRSMMNNNINGEQAIEYLKSLVYEKGAQINDLKEKYNRTQNLIQVYDDIRRTYHEISKGDYISKLVEEKRKEKSKRKSFGL